MAKRKTSAKREPYSGATPKIRLKARTPIAQHDPFSYFRNPNRVAKALLEALQDGDSDAFKEILAAFLEVTNKDEFAKRSGVPRRTLFRMLTPSGNPTLDNIAKVVSALRRAD